MHQFLVQKLMIHLHPIHNQSKATIVRRHLLEIFSETAFFEDEELNPREQALVKVLLVSSFLIVKKNQYRSVIAVRCVSYIRG